MFFKITSPSTHSQRNLIKIINTNLSKKSLLKNKIKGSKTSSGRNSFGRITIRHRGGGHKRKLRKLTFNRENDSIGIILSIEYDPNRNSFISAVYDFMAKNYYYILSPKGITIGNIIKAGSSSNSLLGHSTPLRKIPLGSYIHNVALKKNMKGQVSRSAGTYSILLEKNLNYARIRLSSGKHKNISNTCFATLGIVSNENIFLTSIGKAGRSRWLNKRPKTRGVAMNPIDHPHGGGEGKTSGGKIQLTPWGIPTKNRSTKKFYSNRNK